MKIKKILTCFLLNLEQKCQPVANCCARDGLPVHVCDAHRHVRRPHNRGGQARYRQVSAASWPLLLLALALAVGGR